MADELPGFERDMEFAMMDELVSQCKKRGIKKLIGYYYPTAKNKMVKEFFALQGFQKVSEKEDGAAEWLLDLQFRMPGRIRLS